MSVSRSHQVASLFALPFTRALLALLAIALLGVLFPGGGMFDEHGGFNSSAAFYKWSTHRDMLRQTSVYGILACGMTMVIISGGIDLAVGSILGLNAVVFAILSIHWGWPAWQVIPICLLLGSACGLTSGFFVSRFAIQPFIATLAMMVFARGLAKYVSGGMKISQYVQRPESGFVEVPLPAIFRHIDSRILGGNISVVTLIFIAGLVLAGILLSHTKVGRHLYAVGGNEDAARLSGVPVGRIKAMAYALSGFCCAVAGICQAAQETQGDPEAGSSYELTAIAMVVIGGTSLMGGRGGILLTLLGALAIGYLDKILSINAMSEASRLMLTGAIIISAVLFQRSKK